MIGVIGTGERGGSVDDVTKVGAYLVSSSRRCPDGRTPRLKYPRKLIRMVA